MDPLETTDDDGGSFPSSTIAVAGYVAAPLLGFALLLCFYARCRRGSGDAASARTASQAHWMKDGAVGGTAAVAGVNGAAGSMHGGSHGGGSGSAAGRPMNASQQQQDVNQLNLAEHIAVGGVAGASGSRDTKPRAIARCGSDTAFSMTDRDDNPEDAVVGGSGSGSDSNRGVGTGQSAFPAGYEEGVKSSFDNAAGSVFYAAGKPPASKSVAGVSSNRERNSDRALSRAAAHAGRRQAVPRHSDDVLEAAMAVDGKSRRTTSVR